MVQLGSDFYDRMHAETDFAITKMRYKTLFRRVTDKVIDHRSGSILEVGCGSGLLAEMILKRHNGDYHGFDFSPEAIRYAAARTGRPELFFIGDALDAQSYQRCYDTVVCTEVLEHVDRDLDLIRLWSDGTWCVCSVPNFAAKGHVRFFNNPKEVADRYGQIIQIEEITKVSRPIVPDRRLSSYLRNLRWSRNRPSEFLGFLGIQTFDRLGGWFMFYGTKGQ
jgi:SAM-dependent methyltransferase